MILYAVWYLVGQDLQEMKFTNDTLRYFESSNLQTQRFTRTSFFVVTKCSTNAQLGPNDISTYWNPIIAVMKLVVGCINQVILYDSFICRYVPIMIKMQLLDWLVWIRHELVKQTFLLGFNNCQVELTFHSLWCGKFVYYINTVERGMMNTPNLSIF